MIDNRAYCPRCEQSNYQLTNDYKLVEIEGIKYIEFVGRCLTEGCKEKFYYQSNSSLSGKRYVIDKSKEIEIVDEIKQEE